MTVLAQRKSHIFEREHGVLPNKRMTLTLAKQIIGGSISTPNKMPGTAWGLPATACILGSKLAKIKGTACSVCYALSDRYSWPNVATAQRRRLESLSHPRWVEAMVRVLLHLHRKPIRVDLGVPNAKARGVQRRRYNEPGYHRWLDSGDLQSVAHLAMICEVARQTPKIRHWLPTQQLDFVRHYIASGGVIPDNLVVRVSSIMIDDPVRRAWPMTSSVFRDEPPKDSHVCPAPNQGHFCGSCRACWSATVPHIAYRIH